MKEYLNVTALLFAVVFAGASFAADPSGTWRWEHDDPATGQTIKDVLTLEMAGDKVNGSYEMGGETYEVNNGKIDGNTLSWDFDIEAEGQAINVAFSGDISGDAVAGNVSIGDFGDFPWEAKRDAMVAADPSGIWRWEHDDPTTGQTIKDVLTLGSAGGEIDGSYDMGDVSYDVNNGKVSGNTLSWDFDLDIEGQVVNLRFSGDISGDAVAGNVNIGDFGEFPWEATRDAASAGGGQTSKWVLTFTLPDGTVQNPVLMVTQNSGEFSGVYTDDQGNSLDTEEFTVEGNGFSYTISVPEVNLIAVFSGTVEGTSASGIVKYEVGGESGEIDFTAEQSLD